MAAAPRFDAVFASDVHLSSEHPSTTDAFLRFVETWVAGRTSHFFVLGDLFESWAGDDDLDDPLARTVVAALRELSAGGTDVGFLGGNRDFLIGAAFADAAQLRLLPDPYRTAIGSVDVLLSHGDALCVDDVDYQRFRTMVRDSGWQRDFLAKPLAVRRAIVEGARRQSEAAKRDKAAEIMDVDDGAVVALLDQEPGTTLIHGHTHRPAHHVHPAADGPRDRWVLPDWDVDATPRRGGGLGVVDGRFVALPLR